MASIGPTLPPHLQAKRKRDSPEVEDEGPQPKSPHGRVSPPDPSDDPSKRRRVMGPAPPPAPLDERPPNPPSPEPADDSSSEDDDFGPSLPTAADASEQQEDFEDTRDDRAEQDEQPQKTKRDDWMMLPPRQDDLAARMDPSKQRARGFNTGKGAKGPAAKGGMDSAWTETPEEKRKRLADEVMGISRDEGKGEKAQPVDRKQQNEDEDKARKIKEYNDKHRNESLVQKHQATEKKEKEDDPSRRGFDYEKDMAAVSKVGHKQRGEMLKKAGDFGSRFASGRYL